MDCKQKVVLVNPKLPYNPTQFSIPNNLLYLGTWLHSKGYDVNVLDFYNDGNRMWNVLDKELHEGVLAVGLGVMTAQIKSAIEISEWIKQTRPEVLILWGGVHPTLSPEQVAVKSYVDCTITGEGELAVEAVLGGIKDKGLPFHIIRGMPAEINLLPTPDFELLESVRRVGGAAVAMKLAMKGMPLMTSIGCPHRCNYCVNSITKRKYRFRNTQLVIQDIVKYIEQGINEICFIDEDFLANKPRLLEILDEIERLGLKFVWFGTARADYFGDKRIDERLLERLKNSGCRQLGIGLESGSQRVLDMIHKDITLEDSMHTAKMLNNAGISATFSFMSGLPDETKKDIDETTRFIAELTAINKSFRILSNLYRPYAGSVLHDRCIELGMTRHTMLNDWSNSPYIDSEPSKDNYHLFPWVQYDMKKLVRLIFYCWLAGARTRFGLSNPLRWLGQWRCRKLWFYLPFEMWAFQLVRILRLEKTFSRGKFERENP